MAPKRVNVALGLSDVTDNKSGLGKALIAEAIGVFFINYFGCLSCNTGNLVVISLAFGFIVFVLVQTLAHLSGAHLNPAITAAAIVSGKISILKGLFYIVVQVLGAVAGSGILLVLLPKEKNQPGSTIVQLVTPAQGTGLEFFLGFILVLVVFGVTDPNKPFVKILAPLAIGLTVTVGHLTSVDYTGASMNPARSVGVAVINGHFENHWVYWVGPISGGIVAGLLYTYVLAAPQLGEYSPVNIEDKELKRLDGKREDGLP